MQFNLFPIVYGALTIFLFGLVPCPAWGQVLPKKQLTEADYRLWGTMGQEQLSDGGNWVSYKMSYESGKDTLFIMNTGTKIKRSFPDGISGKFIKEHSFAYLNKNILILKDLETEKETRIDSIKSYDFSEDGRFLVALNLDNKMTILNNGNVVAQFKGVTEYQWNEKNTKLAFVTSEEGIGKVGYLSLNGNYIYHEITNVTNNFKTIKWQSDGNSIAFYGVEKDNTDLYFYNLLSQKLYTLKSSNTIFPNGLKIVSNSQMDMKISIDGKKVFFCVTSLMPKESTLAKDGPEIWNTKDKILYRRTKLRSTNKYPQYLAVWMPEQNTVRQLTTEQQPWIMLTGNQEYALVADPFQYEPQYKFIADMDFYLLNLKTGVQELFLTKQSGEMNHMGISPDGNYITYYKEDNWWTYSLKNKKHINITKGVTTQGDIATKDTGDKSVAWGHAGWSVDSKYVLLYDDNDIWVISPNGLKSQRITKGKEKGLSFRFDISSVSTKEEINYKGSGYYAYDLSKRVVLTALDVKSGANGYYFLEPDKKENALLFDNTSISKLYKAKNVDKYIYVSQRFDNPPTLYLRNESLTTELFKSNTHHSLYQWGKSAMIHFKNSKGITINAALYYPSDYDKSKKYPMIVYIYDIVSRNVNHYVNPTIHNTLGFNISSLTSNGYAILMPDIVYESGKTGFSALECVTNASDKVIELGIAASDKIGLMGHSFGAFETNYIITQTNKFRVAVSGSGVSDIIGHYFTINADFNNLEAWRYENQQYRMGNNFFEDQERYYRNSPLLNAGNVNTPLLTWAGKSDVNVLPRQAETFYAALRRLNKEHTMLVYPNDGHIFYNKSNQVDLTRKISEWFDYYLKDGIKHQWMDPKK